MKKITLHRLFPYHKLGPDLNWALLGKPIEQLKACEIVSPKGLIFQGIMKLKITRSLKQLIANRVVQDFHVFINDKCFVCCQ